MRLKRRSVILVSLSIVLLCVAFGIKSAWGIYNLSTTRTVGVQVGSWAEYSALVEGNWTGFNATNIPISLTITVAAISGTNVTFQTVDNFKNGTQKTGTGSIDVETGSGNMTVWLIAANLTQGDLVYNGTWGLFYTGTIINDTTTSNYLGSNVEVCQSNTTRQNTTGSEFSYLSFNFTWFRSSGFLAEATFNMTEVISGTYNWLYEHVIVTNNSTVPEFPISLVLPLFVALSAFAVASVKKKLVKK